MSEVRLRRRLVSDEINWPAELAGPVEAAKSAWGRFDDQKVLVVLEANPDEDGWVGAAEGPDGSKVIRYREHFGLSVEAS